jgi:hypothetical protein
MATPTQFSLTHKELVELIVKHAGIHEGRWSLTLGFGFSPGVFGPNEDQSSPGVAIVINQINIQREQPNLPPAANSITVDASIVNPASKKK